MVCNACISGASALILAQRLLQTNAYDTAVVCGVDVQSPFILSGFHAFHALSLQPCRPFDAERLGLNLGEGAATMVLQHGGIVSSKQPLWALMLVVFTTMPIISVHHPSKVKVLIWLYAMLLQGKKPML